MWDLGVEATEDPVCSGEFAAFSHSRFRSSRNMAIRGRPQASRELR